MRSASSRAIASPRPVPRAAAPGPRKKRSKMRSSSSGGMPGPSSETITLAPQGVVSVRSVTVEPGGVWRTALSTSTRSTCSTRPSSPRAGASVPELDDDEGAPPRRERLHLACAVGGELAELDLVAGDR